MVPVVEQPRVVVRTFGAVELGAGVAPGMGAGPGLLGFGLGRAHCGGALGVGASVLLGLVVVTYT